MILLYSWRKGKVNGFSSYRVVGDINGLAIVEGYDRYYFVVCGRKR